MLTHQIAAIGQQDAVLIHAASGGVGTMLIQMAKRLGAKLIIGTVSSLEKASIVYQLGAITCLHMINSVHMSTN